MQLTIRPLTPARWRALEDLFGKNGACNGCWCMYWRVGAAYRKAPRDALPWLDRAWRLKRVDEVPVWSLSCLYVRIGYRKRGVTQALIAAAIKFAKRAGAPALEAYPLDGDKTPSASGTGYASAFARAGFKTAGCHVPARPIMRHDLKGIE
jgi:GNAT superfamily N-acetyltransferase